MLHLGNHKEHKELKENHLFALFVVTMNSLFQSAGIVPCKPPKDRQH